MLASGTDWAVAGKGVGEVGAWVWDHKMMLILCYKLNLSVPAEHCVRLSALDRGQLITELQLATDVF